MRKDRSNKNWLNGKGFAIAVVLGVAAISVASLTAYNNTMSRLTPTSADVSSGQNSWAFTPSSGSGSDIPTAGSQNNVPKEDSKERDNPSDKKSDSASDKKDIAANAEPEQPTNEAEEVNKPVVSTARNILPVEGEISHPFSNGELVKSETLGVWKTHDGCDILCPYDTEVRSMSDGVVTEIREDPLWGVYVIVEQNNGLEVHYCGLAKELEIKVGRELKEGEIIGKTADTCQIEIVQEPHLHLGVKQGGQWIDPMSVIEGAQSSEQTSG